jgi:hypothetical protein
MRKKAENSVKRAGKSAIPPDENNDFTPGVQSQSFPPCDFSIHNDSLSPIRSAIIFPCVRALSTIAAETDYRRTLRQHLGRGRLDSALQHRTDPTCGNRVARYLNSGRKRSPPVNRSSFVAPQKWFAFRGLRSLRLYAHSPWQ